MFYFAVFSSFLKYILNIIKYTHYAILFQPSSRFDELPDEFDPSGKLLGSFDDGDPQTTNLYVGNLSPKVWSFFLGFGFFDLVFSCV